MCGVDVDAGGERARRDLLLVLRARGLDEGQRRVIRVAVEGEERGQRQARARADDVEHPHAPRDERQRPGVRDPVAHLRELARERGAQQSLPGPEQVVDVRGRDADSVRDLPQDEAREDAPFGEQVQGRVHQRVPRRPGQGWGRSGRVLGATGHRLQASTQWLHRH